MSLYLLNSTVADVIKGVQKRIDLPKILSVYTETSIHQTLRVLAEHNILSVLVQNPSTMQYEGILSMYEIMSYIAWAAYRGEDPPLHLNDMDVDVHLEAPAAQLLGTSGLMESDEKKGLWQLDGTAPLMDLLEHFGKGVYRVLSITNTPERLRLISQTDLISYLWKHWAKLGPEKDTTVESAGLLKGKLSTVKESDSAIYVFRHLRAKEVQVSPVVNAAGKLVATISASDLRGISPEELAQQLGLDVISFLKARHSGKLRRPVTCRPSDSLYAVVDQLVSQALHRLWLVDDSNRPIGVVSMTDIALYFFTKNLSLWYPPEIIKE